MTRDASQTGLGLRPKREAPGLGPGESSRRLLLGCMSAPDQDVPAEVHLLHQLLVLGRVIIGVIQKGYL
jgi:hypothetical protein